MKMPKHLSRLILTTLIFVAPGLHSAWAADAALTDDGLAPIQAKNLDKAWKRPGANLAGYQGILIRPVSVAFAEHWDSRKYGRFGLRSEEVEKIRSSLAKWAGDIFAREMQRGGYTVATAAGENVLDVEVQIVDLYVNAPDTGASSDVRRYYVLSAGEMRILVTLRDSITGTALFRASDLTRGQETGQLEYANEVWNRVEAERTLAGWAQQVKRALDAAKGN
jgi:Protein of unknown function (DUF3313)